MPKNALSDPHAACVVDWYKAQGILPYPGSPTLRRLSRATTLFWQGPWAAPLFEAGWTGEQLFGIAHTDTPAPGFKHKWTLGLVPQLGLGIFKMILAVEGDVAMVLTTFDRHRGRQRFAFNRQNMDWSRAHLWWRSDWSRLDA